MRIEYRSEYVYVLGLNRSELDSLRGFMERNGFQAGDGYEKDAPLGEWMCWIKKNTGTRFQKSSKEISSKIEEWEHTNISR